MIVSNYRRNSLKFDEIRFGKISSLEEVDSRSADIVVLMQNSSKIGKYFDESATNLLNIDLSEEQLFKNIHQTTRYEIRRADSKDEAQCQFISKPEKIDLEEARDFFESFRKKFDIAPLNLRRLENFSDSRNLVLSYGLVNQVRITMHIYICCSEYSRLLHSASLLEQETYDRNLIGRVNKFHHWQDLLFFKKMGINVYDFGGISSGKDKKLSNIDLFKRRFGGEDHLFYNCSVPTSIKGRAYLGLKGILEAIRK